MATRTLGNLLYRIKAENSDFKKKMKDSGRSFDGLSEKAQKTGKALTAFGVIATGVGFKLAQMASDAGEIQSRFDHVFGAMSDSANNWAENFATSFGQSRSEIKDLMAQLQDTLVPMGVAENKAFELNKQITQLAIDLSSFANVPLEQAMNDIQSGLVGQTETMRKYGVIITETRLKQFALNSGLIETNRELTEEEKIMARVQLMLQDSEKATGDYARTQDSFANQLRETRNLMKNIGEDIGAIVLPAFQDILSTGKTMLEYFNELPDGVKENITQFAMLSTVLAGIGGPMLLIIGYLPQIAAGFKAISSAAAFLGPYGWLAIGIGAVTTAIMSMRQETQHLSEDFMTLNKKEVEQELAVSDQRIKELQEERKRLEKEMNEAPLTAISDRWNLAGEFGEAGRELKKERERNAEIRERLKLLNKEKNILEEEDGSEVLTKYEKAMRDFDHAMATGGMPLEDQLSTLNELYDDLADKQFKLTHNLIDEEDLDMTADEIEDAMIELEEKLFSTREQIATNYYNKVAQEEQQAYSMGQNNIENMIDTYENMLDSIENDERLSYETREGLIQQFNDRIMQLEHQRATGINELNRQVADKEYELNADELDNKLRALELEKESIKDAYLEKLGHGEEYNQKVKELDELYLRLRQQAYEEFYDEIEAEEDRIMRFKYETEEISLEDYKSYLQERLNSFEKYSEEWIRIYQEIQALEDNSGGLVDSWLADIFSLAGYEIEEANDKFGQLRDEMVRGFTDMITKGESFADVLTNILDSIAEIIIQRGIIEPLVDSILSFGGGDGGFVDGLFSFFTAHTGGKITSAGLIRDLPEYHTGGRIPGLKSDEVAIKAQTGERVLSRNQNAAFEAGEYGKQEVYVINAVDAPSFQKLLAENKASIVNIAGENITNNGQLRKIIQRFGG